MRAACPLPERVTVCGVPLALSTTKIVAVRVPTAVGMNSKVTVQTALIASVEAGWGHVLPTMAKSPGLAPPRLMDVKLTVPVPVLVMLNDCVALAVPTFCAVVNV